MKRTNLVATLVGIIAVGILADDASAYYHAQMGRFINRDPIGYRDGTNLYAYTSSNPVCATDPSGKETMFTPRQRAYAKRHCKCACLGGISIGDYLLGNADKQMGNIMTFALDEAGKHTFDAVGLANAYYGDDASAEEIQSIRDDMTPDGRQLSQARMLHSALRHCIGAGMLASATSCRCSQCLSDHREYYQLEHYAATGQNVRTTQAVLDNNYVGRQCAGCQGARATQAEMKYVHTSFHPPAPGSSGVGAQIPIYKSRGQIINCCVNALKTAQLDVRIGTPKGAAEIVKMPDYVRIPKEARK